MKTALHPTPGIFQLAFTRIELLTISAILFVMVIVLGFQLARAKEKQHANQCVNNLKNVGLAFRLWYGGSADTFPFERPTEDGGTMGLTNAFDHFRTLSNDLSKTEMLVCPSTRKKPAFTWDALQDANVSYFVGLSAAETYPQAFLAGDSGFLISGKPPLSNRVEFTRNTDLSYPETVHRGIANIACGDGSVQRYGPLFLKEGLRNTGIKTNILLTPR